MNDQEDTDLIISGLREPEQAVSYYVGRKLAETYKGSIVVQTQSYTFDLVEYAQAGHCLAEPLSTVFSESITTWHGPEYGLHKKPGNAAFAVLWQGHNLKVILVSWIEGLHPTQGIWIVADEPAIAEKFLIAVSEWCSDVRGEILVFESGCWSKSKELYESVQSTTFDSLILPDEMKVEIREDFRQFFNSRDEYNRYGIPWKRGILFHGTPGNGKTHTLKALVNELKQPCLYVKSFTGPQYESEHDMIRKVFTRARQTTPCLLVLEDLDSLINDSNRSFFLNEMDGFAANTGIVVLATTNHPERLDPAILERPSRFDRKYSFPLPTPEERLAYLTLWNNRSQPELRLTEVQLGDITSLTDEFSFAYLKELWLSSMMKWIAVREPGAMASILTGQVDSLRLQMNTPISEAAPAGDVRDERIRIMQAYRSRRPGPRL
jgi:hypothetical protein